MRIYILLTLALSGCAQVKFTPAQGNNVSNLKLVNTIPSGAMTDLNVFKGPICDQAHFIGNAGEVGHKIDVWKSEDSTKVEAGKPVYLSVGHSKRDMGATSYIDSECYNFFSFTPKAGKTYIIKSNSTGLGRCSFELKEELSSVVPEDLKELPSGSSCIVSKYNF
ncbi:MAG: hypothetical protein U1F46_04795 [Marinagarivorans sp.]